MDELSEKLKSIVGASNVECAAVMASHTTFGIGGPADYVVVPHSVDELQAVAATCREGGLDMRVMGLGSNLLVSDEGLRCVVIRIADNLADVALSENTIEVQAGASNASVARAACAAGLAGYEFAGGIPGTVGGAAIMNAGAYGGEFKDVAIRVRCLTPDGVFVDVDADEAAWSYRQSMMARKGYIIVSATLQLSYDDPAAIEERMTDLDRRRAEKQPLDKPSAGSTFKRPEGYFVGKLVQDAGLRGYRVGGAQVSEKHTGFIVNAGGATAADVRQLIAEVQARVYTQAGVKLEPEVRMWGFDCSC